MDPASPVFPLLFVPRFLAMWLGVGGLLAMMSGWLELARRYPGGPRPAGMRLRGQVTRNNVTGLVVTDRGLYLYPNVLFRFGRPPVLVPWNEVEDDGERSLLWWRRHVLRLGGVTAIHVKQRAYDAVRPFVAHDGDASAD